MGNVIAKGEAYSFFAVQGIILELITDTFYLGKGLCLISGMCDIQDQEHWVSYILWRDIEGLLKSKLILDTLDKHPAGIFPEQNNWLGNELYLKILNKELRFEIEEFA